VDHRPLSNFCNRDTNIDLFLTMPSFYFDTRQSRYKNVVSGSHLDSAFDEIRTYTEGFVVNGGIKLKIIGIGAFTRPYA